MRACSSDGYKLFGHLGGLRDLPGELAPYPSGFPPEASPLEAPDPTGGNPLG